jgi:hypothetical protein
MKKVSSAYYAALWAMERQFRKINADVAEQIGMLRLAIQREFPVMTRATSAVLGPVLLWTSRREEKRLAAGCTYEPPIILERSRWVLP